MRFHYILRTNDDIDGGVCKKIRSQIRSLRNLGTEVVIHRNNENLNLVTSPMIKRTLGDFFNKIAFFSILIKLKREFLVNSALYDLIRSSGKNDILYFRYPFPSLKLSRILKKPRVCRIAIEYQSIEPLEFRVRGEWIFFFIDLIMGGPIRKNSDIIVGVTDEITRYELRRSGIPGKKHITIGNGFDVTSVQVRTPPPFNQRELSIVCVAEVQHWHGVDRIIAGIAQYAGPVLIKLHIAGNGAEIPYLQKMVEEKGLKDKVIFHGFVSGPVLDAIFDQCHIAAGSLGIHRIGLSEASILKAREYCSRGIPFILACEDPDFPGGFPCVQTVPADETPVSMNTIIHFTTMMFQDPDHPRTMRDHAEKYLDWSVKMRQLQQFLENSH
jgi:glycosyltransferase involved in cell wall biosynthesis